MTEEIIRQGYCQDIMEQISKFMVERQNQGIDFTPFVAYYNKAKDGIACNADTVDKIHRMMDTIEWQLHQQKIGEFARNNLWWSGRLLIITIIFAIMTWLCRHNKRIYNIGRWATSLSGFVTFFCFFSAIYP